MKIPKNYYHDKSVLALVGANAALLVLSISYILTNVDTDINTTSIVSFRSSRSIQVSGSTSELYQFAIFALLVTLVSFILSMKLYNLRRQLSLSILGLNIITITLCLVVFNALTRTL